MIAYIKTMIADLEVRIGFRQIDGLESRFAALCDELNRLEPKDFEPAARYNFVQLRRAFREYRAAYQDNSEAMTRFFSRDPKARLALADHKPILSRLELLDCVTPHIGAGNGINVGGCAAFKAYQSVGALMRICDHIEKNHP
jgi:hypothetical protein